eukprot:3207831-Pleurochrysis_carterae.AAC.1
MSASTLASLSQARSSPTDARGASASLPHATSFSDSNRREQTCIKKESRACKKHRREWIESTD